MGVYWLLSGRPFVLGPVLLGLRPQGPAVRDVWQGVSAQRPQLSHAGCCGKERARQAESHCCTHATAQMSQHQ